MFLDTSGLLCLHNRAEPSHAQARTLYHAARGRLTHNYVLAEFCGFGQCSAFAPHGRTHLHRRPRGES